MAQTIAQRITTRLKDLGKNPSNVALEAGLGRSAVRDILVGKVDNPRIDTLRKLAGPLECSLEFLTGASDVPGSPDAAVAAPGYFDPQEVQTLALLEAGVFRSGRVRELSDVHWEKESDGSVELKPNERFLMYNDLRLPRWSTSLYRVKDRSLQDIGIQPGDVLTVAAPPDEDWVPLKPGTIVIVTRRISALSKPVIDDLEETSARIVEIDSEMIRLACRSKDNFPAIELRAVEIENLSELDEKAEKVLPNYYFIDDGSVTIEGIAVRVTRELPID